MSKKFTLSILCLLTAATIFAQKNTLYSKAYGSENNPPIIFLHGGPGYNCAGFEISTAQVLADAGYYVIVYDQRGCARSKDFLDNSYTLENYLTDIDSIYARYHLTKASLMGHSWGGSLATFYAKKYIGKVDRLILVGSPVSYQATFSTMIGRCKAYYTDKNDTTALAYMTSLGKADTSTLMYASAIFMHAFACKLYSPKEPTEERKEISTRIKADPNSKYMSANDAKPVQGLFRDIHHTTLNTTNMLRWIKNVNDERLGVCNIFGIFGNEDGLFDDAQLKMISNITGERNFHLVPGASHNIFIDQQKLFIAAVKKIMG